MKKYKINSNKEKLEAIGISYEINGLVGTLVKTYPNNWLVLEVIHKVGDFEFINQFDLPEYMCEVWE